MIPMVAFSFFGLSHLLYVAFTPWGMRFKLTIYYSISSDLIDYLL
jgi:hypothetical protein